MTALCRRLPHGGAKYSYILNFGFVACRFRLRAVDIQCRVLLALRLCLVR